MAVVSKPVADHVDRQRLLHRLVFDWCLTRAEHALSQSDEPAAMNWGLVAAQCAYAFGCGELASQRLETLGLALARSIPVPKETSDSPRRVGRWLHVMSLAFDVGGHSRLVQRWIENDVSGETHDLVVTCMSEFDFPELLEAVAARGGKVTMLGSTPSHIERARRLREIAWARADRVVLHAHPFDMIPAMAFGISGGPPVILLNHADHLFWIGAAISDQVINLREASEDLCVRLRGIDRNAILPIPLPLPAPNLDRASSRAKLRQRLYIPANALVFLTIGSAFKYRAIGDLDFVAMARRLLATLPDCHLVAVGPDAKSSGWADLSRDFKPRIHALGDQRDLAAYHAAADIYLEGFPFGSITALLEAGLTGLPFVRLPRTVPPPFSSARYALSVLDQPADTDVYFAQAVALAKSSEARRSQGTAARDAITSFHCGNAWRAKLAAFKKAAPPAHSIYPVQSAPLPDAEDRFWAQFLMNRPNPHPLAFMAEHARARKLHPHVDFTLVRTAMAIGKGSSKLSPLVWWAMGRHCTPIVSRALEIYMRYVGWRFQYRGQRRARLLRQSD